MILPGEAPVRTVPLMAELNVKIWFDGFLTHAELPPYPDEETVWCMGRYEPIEDEL